MKKKLTFILALMSLFIPLAAVAGTDALSYRLQMPPDRGARALSWGKDPFVPAIQAPATAIDLKLTAVFYSAQNPSAIVNDRIVYRGSLVRGQKVIDIGSTHVILQGDRGRLRLELSEIPELQDANKKD
ncbi:MAG: hypothetical protein HYV23_07280 [Deltaproteobacteria bacterium]|nr:hypothetical protein [Deltaproteobacteria bacterium]